MKKLKKILDHIIMVAFFLAITVIIALGTISLLLGRQLQDAEIKAAIRAFATPTKEDVMKCDGVEYKYSLPKRTSIFLENEQTKKYYTFAKDDDLRKYFKEDLKEYGWEFVEQMDNSIIMKNEDYIIIVEVENVVNGIKMIKYNVCEEK